MSQDTQSQIAESKVKQAFVGLQMLFVAFGVGAVDYRFGQ